MSTLLHDVDYIDPKLIYKTQLIDTKGENQ